MHGLGGPPSNRSIPTLHAIEIQKSLICGLYILVVDVVVVALPNYLLHRKILNQVIGRISNLLILETKMSILRILRIHMRQLLLNLSHSQPHRLRLVIQPCQLLHGALLQGRLIQVDSF